ncbi:MAG: sigma-54 interaction domain-containing protein [Bacteroidota bacterium]
MDREAFQERYGLLGRSAAMRHVIDKVVQVAGTDITVLMQGESGVGKDVTARAIHALSERKHHDLVIVNCGAIPEGIIESELFGHEKGSFTGANETRQGYFEKADGGTIFLDEIGDTPKNVQVKLLRILESGEYFRVGSSQMRTTDARVIAATNQDLWKLVEDGSFREDLYYRLDTVRLTIPPLRDRTEDILPIFEKFVQEYSAKYDSVFRGLSDDARDLLVSYRWPGNIRELRNVAEQLVVLEKSQFVDKESLQKYLKGRQRVGQTDHLPVLGQDREPNEEPRNEFRNDETPLIYRALLELQGDMSDLKKMLGQFLYSQFSSKQIRALPAAMQRSIDPNELNPDLAFGRDQESPPGRFGPEEREEENSDPVRDYFKQGEIPSIEDTEKFLIVQALKHFKGNRRKASEALGISERTLYRKLDQYELE